MLLPSSSSPPSRVETLSDSELSELNHARSSLPPLFSAQDGSILLDSRFSYTSISEETSTSPRLLPGALTAEPQEGVNALPFRNISPLPSSSPTLPAPTLSKSPRFTRSCNGSQHVPRHFPRHPTREPTRVGLFSRPGHIPPRWPFRRPTINRLISVATDTFAGPFFPIPQQRDAEALERFWPMYANEARHFDQQMLAAWNKHLDVRLLFAGLFSAIVTPFIIESYRLLHGYPSPSFFGPGGYAVRVNAMWIGSLVINLISALLSIHFKQWLDGYSVDFLNPRTRDTLLSVCRLRQYRYEGLEKWHIDGLISFLPMLLYTSVLFFAIGMVDWLWHLNTSIAIFVTTLCGLVVIFGITTTFLPMFTTRTPFKTPMSCLLGNLWRGIWRRELRIKDLMEEEEMNVVDVEGECLDEGAFQWLMKHTRDEQIYQDAIRAEKEYFRQRGQHRRASNFQWQNCSRQPT